MKNVRQVDDRGVSFLQVRYTQLMKQQEKMIQDMEKSITRREYIITRYSMDVFEDIFLKPDILRRTANWGMGPNFDVSAPLTFVTEIQTNLKV